MRTVSAEIGSVQPQHSDPDAEVCWAVDWPRPGGTDPRALKLQGWVLARSGEPAVGVEVLAAGNVVARLPLDRPRPDLEKMFPRGSAVGRAGFAGAVNVLAVRSTAELRLRAILADHRRLDLAAVELKPSRRDGPGPGATVAVVIPCFNQAHFLGEAIESVLAQSHDQVEVVVVDDGSRDNTVEVAGRYPGVRYVAQENRGLAAARNTGLEHATGDFVLFLDSDDRLLPGAVESGLRELQADPEAVMAAGAWRLIGEDGQELPASPPQLPEDVYPALLESCFISTPAAVLYRRRLFDEIGGFDSAVDASADYDLYLRAAARHRVRTHGDLVAEYRRHGANMTRDAGLIMRAETAVLRRQSPLLAGRPELARARERGLRRSRAYHGDRMVEEVRRLAEEGRREEALRIVATLARLDPRGVRSALRALRGKGPR